MLIAEYVRRIAFRMRAEAPSAPFMNVGERRTD